MSHRYPEILKKYLKIFLKPEFSDAISTVVDPFSFVDGSVGVVESPCSMLLVSTVISDVTSSILRKSIYI